MTEPPAPELPAAAPLAEKRSFTNDTERSLLVVDDEPAARAKLRRLLADCIDDSASASTDARADGPTPP